jgi:UDP-arabinose 4-epimerase
MTAPALYLRNNFVNTLNLLDAMREHGVNRFVFSSTAAVYGDPQRLPLTEDHPQNPVNPYGETKLMVERALAWYGHAYNLSWTALRYFNAAGADPDGEIGEVHDPETHLIPLAIAAAHGHSPELRMFGTDYDTPDGTAVRDYIHVNDLADAHLRALERLSRGGASRAFNLGTGRGYTVKEVLSAVERIGRCKVPVETCPRRAGDAPVLVADSSLAARELGWTPLASLDHIVETAWNWYTTSRANSLLSTR